MKAVYYFCAFCLVSVLVARTDAQFPFMGGFQMGMDNMMRNLGNMMGNMQAGFSQMGRQMAMTNARQQAMAERYAVGLPPGQGRPINDGVRRGYVFRNLDGSLSFSLGDAGSSGYVFRTGPGGQVFEQRW